MEYATASQASARKLLSAWASEDPGCIGSAAEYAEAARPASTLESERIEMIRAAGRVLRDSAGGTASDEDLNASLRLLRHLAEN